jgi:hypothetical protein
MNRLRRCLSGTAVLYIGLGGHYYVVSKNRGPVAEVAAKIGRSPRSVYHRSDFDCYALRVRRERDKQALRRLFREAKSA